MDVVKIEGSLHLYGDIGYMYAHILQDTCEKMVLTYWNGKKKTQRVTKMEYSDFLERYQGKKVEVDEDIVLQNKEE